MTGKTREDFLSLVKSYLNIRKLQLQDVQKLNLLQRCFEFLRLILHVMSSAEQKHSLVKDYNKQFQVYGLTDPLKVPIS